MLPRFSTTDPCNAAVMDVTDLIGNLTNRHATLPKVSYLPDNLIRDLTVGMLLPTKGLDVNPHCRPPVLPNDAILRIKNKQASPKELNLRGKKVHQASSHRYQYRNQKKDHRHK